MRDQRIGINPKVVVILAIFFTGTNSVFFRLSNLPPMVFVTYRFLVCTLFFLIVFLIKTKTRQNEKKMVEKKMIEKKLIAILFSTGFIFAAGAYFYFIALKNADVSNVVILNSSSTLFVVVFSSLFLGEKTSKLGFAMLLIVFFGCATLLISPGGSNSFKGDICALLCAVCYATYLVVIKKFADVSVPMKLLITYLGSFSFAFAVALVQGGLFEIYPREEYLYAIGSAVFAICIPQSMINWALRNVRATFVGGINLLEPVMSCIYAFLLWNEMLEPNQVIGGVLVLAGLFLYNKVESNKET